MLGVSILGVLINSINGSVFFCYQYYTASGTNILSHIKLMFKNETFLHNFVSYKKIIFGRAFFLLLIFHIETYIYHALNAFFGVTVPLIG